MKIIVTGGHVTPALAVIEDLKKHKDVEIIFVGRKYALDFEKIPSFEYQSIKHLEIKFIELKAGRLTRMLSWRSIVNFLRFPLGFFYAFKILEQEKPNIILSFGGYIAFPIALLAFFLRIPVYIHEQTLVPGLTNRIISLFARKAFISFPETKQYFKARNVVFTGNPLRMSVFQIKNNPFKIFRGDKKIIYITGGTLGAHSLNTIIENILDKLLDIFVVIHQTGDTEEYQDFERLSKIKNKNYFVKKNFYDDEIGYVFSLADFVISRSGANTVFELIALQKPAILIPLPWSAHGEQTEQAKLLHHKGVAEIFFQDKYRADCSDNLYKLILKVSNNLAEYQNNFNNLSDYYKKDAVQRIISHILPKI